VQVNQSGERDQSRRVNRAISFLRDCANSDDDTVNDVNVGRIPTEDGCASDNE
jgi:hypothetical protein